MDVTKTLRYYAEIGLLQPSEIDPENGYRYYAIEQLEKMLFINRLKAYSFSLDEIKAILQSEEMQDDHLQLEKTITFHSKEEQMAFYKATDISCWVAGPTGVNTAGWGLTLSPMDMAKIGQLFLNGGVWNGNRIVSEKWVSDSTSEQSRWKQRDLPYGYLWWIDEQDNGYAAMGDGGNIIYVRPDKNMVVASTSLFYPRAKDRIEFIKKYVEPIFEEEK